MRPEALALLIRWREVAAAAALAALGLWTAAHGGLLLTPLGAAIVALALAWGLNARRRMRFHQTVAAPGIVEVTEGQVAYFGPAGTGPQGGMIALPDLVELHLVARHGRRAWRLRQTDGQVLTIPVDAAGADLLFDAFVMLPGMDSAALVAALAPDLATGTSLPAAPVAIRRVWTRPGTGLIPRAG